MHNAVPGATVPGMGADHPRPDHPRPDPVTPLFPGGEPQPPGAFQQLYERRILFLRGTLDDALARELAAQLIAQDAAGADAITLYIDSPGGDASAMFTLHDTVEMLRSPVHACCVGQAGSAAAFLLATATGTRTATPNARIMLRQPAGGGEGTAEDIESLARELARMGERFERIMAERTGKPVETIRRDTRREFWLSPEEALDYGLLDEVVSSAGRRA